MNMKNQTPNKTFETTDFGLASFLYAKEVPFLGIRPIINSKRSLFVFEETQDCQQLKNAFFAGSELIEPLKLLNAEKQLKRQLYSGIYKYENNEETY